MLASGGLVLLGGRAADVAGRRRIFLAGLAVFTAASLASGLAPAAGPLIAARAGQGLGAALLSSAALSIITTSYAGAQRATALGVWGALGGAGAAVGVLAGGVLTTWLGWRSVFLVNVPDIASAALNSASACGSGFRSRSPIMTLLVADWITIRPLSACLRLPSGRAGNRSGPGRRRDWSS